jgi:hypothetical protein
VFRDTLTADLLIDYIKERNILVWAGNVRESEAHKGKKKKKKRGIAVKNRI